MDDLIYHMNSDHIFLIELAHDVPKMNTRTCNRNIASKLISVRALH
ncbi:hypothetical protein NC651_018663 [Populus alba x Populus x berolinensis]|nr:hypothetical protein NC651_018663 [Populus alba x Populus x berolinensis]